MFFLIFVFIDFSFYVNEAVDWHAFVMSLAAVSVSTMDRRVVSYLFLLATTAHAFLVVVLIVIFVLICTSTILLILFFLVFILIAFGFYIKEAVDQRALWCCWLQS